MRRPPACAVVLLVLASACSSGDGAAPTPTNSPVTATDTTQTSDATPTSSLVTVDVNEGERSLEGEWFDSGGGKTLVIEGNTAEFFFSRGAFAADLEVDPSQITLPSDSGQQTLIFNLEDGRMQLVLQDAAAPLPESIEAAADDPDRYFVLELFRGDVLFPSGVWTPSGRGLPAMYNVQDMTAAGGSMVVGSISIDHGMFISTDSGATWRRAGGGFPESEPVWALTTVGGRLFAGTQGLGVFVSDDGGETWNASNEGLAALGPDCPGDPGAPHSQIGDIAGFASTVFVVSFCGVSRSDDLGETWREIDEGLGLVVNFGGSSLAVGDGLAYLSTTGRGLFRLDGERDRWDPVSGAVELPTGQAVAGDSLFAASTARLQRSDDGGASWTDLGAMPGGPVLDLAVGDGFIFALTNGIFWTTDLGDTWHPYNTVDLPDVFALEVQGERLFAIGPLGVFSAPLPNQLPAVESAGPGGVPEGFETFDGSAYGFLISLPAGWLAIDVTAGDQQSIAAELEAIVSPEVAEILSASYVQTRKTKSSDLGGLVMVAFDATSDPNLNVTVSPRRADDTLESWEEILRTGVETSGGAVSSIDQFEVSGQEALRMATLLQHEFGTSELIQYIVLSESTTYNITFSIQLSIITNV